MKTRERYQIEIDAGTTFRFGFKAGEIVDEERVYFDDTDLSKVVFQVRSSDNNFKTGYAMDFEDGMWTVEISSAVTAGYSSHRSMYFVIDATFASGDVKRLLEGPIRVRPMGGGKVYR